METNLEKINKNTSLQSVGELQEKLSSLTEQLEKCQMKLYKLCQYEEVYVEQETLLKKQADDLIKLVNTEQLKLDNICKQAEAQVEDFVGKINNRLKANKDLFGVQKNGEADQNEHHAREIRRKKYYQIKGEIGALLLYKEYQECVIEELERVENPNAALLSID